MATLPNSLFNICHRIIRPKIVGAARFIANCIKYWQRINYWQLTPTLPGHAFPPPLTLKTETRSFSQNITIKLPSYSTMFDPEKREQLGYLRTCNTKLYLEYVNSDERRHTTQMFRQKFWKMYAAGSSLKCFAPFNSWCKLIIGGSSMTLLLSCFCLSWIMMMNADYQNYGHLTNGWMDRQMDIWCRTANTQHYHKSKNDLSAHFPFLMLCGAGIAQSV
jgi:hypothetical protein